MYYQFQSHHTSFSSWIFKTKQNRILLLVSTLVVVISFVIFKIIYPFPNFLPDSYSYLLAAGTNQDINMWPIGYSKFLRFFSSFTHSDTALIFFQYLAIQSAITYFLFTIIYLFGLSIGMLRLLFCFGILNPLWLYVANFISSDALFSALSIVWFTQLLWIGHRAHNRLLFWHGLVIVLAFMLRFNALYYPFISISFLLFTKSTLKTKLAGMAFIGIFIGSFLFHNYRQYDKLTDTRQFSAFSGWQLAANALYGYAQVAPQDRKPVPASFRELQRVVDHHMDSLNQLSSRPDSTIGIYYMWDEKAPLKKFVAQKYQGDTLTDHLKRWASVGPLYHAYGLHLIREYPSAYFRNFIQPNAMRYYAPETEFLGIQNMGRDTVEALAKEWFMYKDTKVPSRAGNPKIVITEIFTPLFAIINIIFVLGFLGYIFLDGIKKNSLYFSRALIWMFIVWISNFVFSLLASPLVLRYQVAPMIMTSVFMILLLAYIIREAKAPVPSSTSYSYKPQIS